MQAEPRAQLALLDIATLDQQAVQLRHRKQTLPVLTQLSQLAKQRTLLLEQIVAAATKVGDAQAELDRVLADLEPANARLKRNQEMIDAGSVPAKSLTALIDETNHLRGRIGELEDAQLEAMENVDVLTAASDELTRQRSELEDQMRTLIAERDAAAGQIDDELAANRAQRAHTAKGVPADLLDLYDKITARLGSGAAELRDRHCTGCGLELDVAERARHAGAAPDAVLRCEECGRILVRTGRSGL